MGKRSRNPNRKNPPSGNWVSKTRRFSGGETNLRFGLNSTAKRFVSLFKLSPSKRGSKNILRNKLRETFLKSLTVRTILEEQCLTLAAETARIEDITSRYKPNKIPLGQGLKLHQAALKVLKIAKYSRPEGSVARENFEKMAEEMEKTAEEIQNVLSGGARGHLEISQQKFFEILFVGDSLIRNKLESKGIDPYTRIGFEEINRIVEKNL